MPQDSHATPPPPHSLAAILTAVCGALLGAGLKMFSSELLGLFLIIVSLGGLWWLLLPIFSPHVSFPRTVLLWVGWAAILAVGLFSNWRTLFPPPPQPSSPVQFKIVGAAQFLPDDQEGLYIVVPDVQLTNRDTASTVVNVTLLVEKSTGVSIHFEPSAARIPDIEHWLTQYHVANANFLGRQITIPAHTGVNGYMVFYADRRHLAMGDLNPDQVHKLPLSFQIEQDSRSPRTLSMGEAIIGR